ncbi:MarR family transcriptional regulator [Streptomyces sp. NPDC000351]|uniref:MarR family winged helix-turn-helix transcriptional regulator n=1 Tax=Streptomyces sp. NPDC000351 TaxID=3154250 RepID=UPI00331A46B6
MPSDALVDALARVTFHMSGVLTRIGAKHDLSLTQLRVLGLLRDRRPRMTELAEFLGLDKSTMSGLIDRAERRGLVKRDKNPEDRRAVDVVITPAGLVLAEQVYDELRRALAPTLSGLGPAHRDQLVELLNAARKPSD